MALRLRDRVGLNVAPLLLRLMLGIVFLWAGLGKVSVMMEVSGEPAAVLANMGVISPAPSVPAAPKAETPKPAPEANPPQAKPPDTKAPETKPAETKPGGGASAPPAQDGRVVLVRRQPPARLFIAADFPSPFHVRRLYGLALLLHSAASSDGDPGKMLLWPPNLAVGSTPVYLAWSVAITELAGGICLLLGLLTRLAAIGVAGVMLGAIWLTQIGPAMQSGKTVLGFLPDYPTFDVEKWMPLLFQFALCMAALALAFCGPGRLSLDTALLSGRGEDDDDD